MTFGAFHVQCLSPFDSELHGSLWLPVVLTKCWHRAGELNPPRISVSSALRWHQLEADRLKNLFIASSLSVVPDVPEACHPHCLSTGRC